MLAETVEKTK
jgi:hypothetical protein